MILVLFVHYFPHRLQQTPVTIHEAPLETIFNLELHSICVVCLNVFVIVSGYFGIRRRRKSIVRLVSDIWFWLLLALAVYISVFDHQMSVAEIGLSLLHSWCAWFIVGYLGLYILSPVLNAFIDHVGRQMLLKVTLVFWGFAILYGYFIYGIMHAPRDFNEGMSILAMSGLYLIGACLRGVRSKWLGTTAYGSLWRFLFLTCIMTAGASVALLMGIKASPYGYLNPIVLCESVLLFMVFRNMRPSSWPVVNSLAKAAFSVYIVHQVSVLTTQYHQVCSWIQDNFTYPLFPAIGFMVAVYIVVWVIYTIWCKIRP